MAAIESDRQQLRCTNLIGEERTQISEVDFGVCAVPAEE